MLLFLGILLSLACLVVAFFWFANLCSVANGNSTRAPDTAALFFGGLIVCILCGFLAFMCFYYYLHPVSRGFYKKQEAQESDTVRVEKELMCESVAFQLSDDCSVVKITRIPKTVVVTYGEPTAQIINVEPEGLKSK